MASGNTAIEVVKTAIKLSENSSSRLGKPLNTIILASGNDKIFLNVEKFSVGLILLIIFAVADSILFLTIIIICLIKSKNRKAKGQRVIELDEKKIMDDNVEEIIEDRGNTFMM
ncbi:MAG: hypothetical protein MHMPM18_001212 [Marteilia pararefringens]